MTAGAFGGIYLNEKFFNTKEEIVLPTPTPNPNPTPDPILPDIVDQVQTVSIEEVSKILEPASELITAKYYYTEASTYQNFKKAFDKYKVPFTTDEAVFTYDGIISVGVELSEIEINVDNEKQIITIKLPSVKEMHNEVDHDSFDVPYTKDSPFTKTNMKDYTTLIAELKKAKSEEVMKNKEFIAYAKDNTTKVLEAFLKASPSTTDYEVKFKWSK